MQYVRSLGGSVSKTWNSINPATLSGAIDVIVIEQEDGSLACSPFHVRFGKFSLLRPYEKKVEFKVNDVKQSYSMKLGEGGEAFFVFETSEDIPESLQTSPVLSPASSPQSIASQSLGPSQTFQEPEFLDLNTDKGDEDIEKKAETVTVTQDPIDVDKELGAYDPTSASESGEAASIAIPEWELQGPPSLRKVVSDELLPAFTRHESISDGDANNASIPLDLSSLPELPRTARSVSPPPLSTRDAVNRAKTLSEKLSGSNIPSQITESGDLMLDMTGYKSSEEDALRAEVVARKILAEELAGNYDIGALISADENGNIWIYRSEEAKEAASQRLSIPGLDPSSAMNDAASDPGHQSDEEDPSGISHSEGGHQRTRSESDRPGETGVAGPDSYKTTAASVENKNYAKTLRLTSEQLKALGLKVGPNSMSFGVNKSVCHAYMYFWKHDVPIVISDIDGTITKSDALGHVLNMIGRDWTHTGVAKLYTDIVANGYHMLYLTSRSVGQADTTRAYLNGVIQEGFKLPRGPVIMSPDRTIAALRREIYLRKPEVFKMACLRDILGLFAPTRNPFYAGFGNRLTDALSYRSVNIPSTRIFTINSYAEVSLDLLTLNTYKSSYVTMRELIDQFFPPVGLLVRGGGEEYTDFNYWRDTPLSIDDILDSDDEEDHKDIARSDDELSVDIDSEEDLEFGEEDEDLNSMDQS